MTDYHMLKYYLLNIRTPVLVN